MSKLITEKKIKIEIPPAKTKERLDLFLTNSIENATRTKVQKLIEAGFVLVNGKPAKSNYKILPRDILDITIPISPRPETAEPEDIPLDIVFEDEYIIVVNKPSGMVAHPAYSNYTGTLVNALLHHTNKLSRLNEPAIRPGIVHRIDKDTSGLLLVAKDEYVHAQLARQFSKHTIEREYWAVTWGKFKKPKGEISFNIVRSKADRKKFTHTTEDEGKTAITLYEIIREYDFASLVKLNLKTGRTHQIRVHLSAINHPIFGDSVYGGRTIHCGHSLAKIKSRVANLLDDMPRQALHAKTLGFIHPKTQERLRFDSELPADMKNLLIKL